MNSWATKVTDLPRRCVCGAEMMGSLAPTSTGYLMSWRYWHCERWFLTTHMWLEPVDHLFLIQQPNSTVWHRWTEGRWA